MIHTQDPFFTFIQQIRRHVLQKDATLLFSRRAKSKGHSLFFLRLSVLRANSWASLIRETENAGGPNVPRVPRGAALSHHTRTDINTWPLRYLQSVDSLSSINYSGKTSATRCALRFAFYCTTDSMLNVCSKSCDFLVVFSRLLNLTVKCVIIKFSRIVTIWNKFDIEYLH